MDIQRQMVRARARAVVSLETKMVLGQMDREREMRQFRPTPADDVAPILRQRGYKVNEWLVLDGESSLITHLSVRRPFLAFGFTCGEAVWLVDVFDFDSDPLDDDELGEPPVPVSAPPERVADEIERYMREWEDEITLQGAWRSHDEHQDEQS
jgi:hypothetical protein